MRSASSRLLVAAAALSLAPAALAQPDLCVDGEDEITIIHAFGDPLPQISYTVSNCGTGPDLNWTANIAGVLDAFTSLDNSGGTITDIGGTAVVNLEFDLSAAPTGAEQVGAVRFFQDGNPEFAKIVRFTLVKTAFELGDSLVGDLATPDDVEVGAFQALEGTKVKLAFKPDDKNLRARIMIASSDGVLLKSFKTKKKGKKTKKKFKLPSTGEFALILEPLEGTGTYGMNTKRKKLPKMAKPRLETKLKAGGSGMVEVPIGAHAGAVLNANVVAQGSTDIAGLSVTLFRPDGTSIDTSSFDATSATAFHLVQVPLPDFGVYVLRVSGMTADDKVNIPLAPYQPDQGNGNIDLDG